MSDYADRQQKIAHKKIAQGQKDLGRKCHCGLIRAHHTAVQANTCKKLDGKDTMGSIMTEQQINEGDFAKI